MKFTALALALVWSGVPTHGDAAGDNACTTGMDCSLGGDCVQGQCQCLPTFTGPKCAQLNLVPAENRSLVIPGTMSSDASWGGNVVQDRSDGSWHLFYAEFLNGCGLDSWGTNSVVAHAISQSASGPFKKVDVVQPAFHHNPTIAFDPSSKNYLLFSIGDGNSTPINCTATQSHPNWPAVTVGDPAAAGIITLSYSSSPHGPWTTLPAPVLAGRPGKWDYFVTNPSVHVFNNGTVLMAYRGGWNPWHVGIAVSSSFREPFVRTSDDPAFPVVNEDPGLFLDERGRFHILTHYFGPNGPGGHAYSADGLTWAFAGMAYNFTIQYQDGAETKIGRRERPQVLSIEGKPRWLFTGVQPLSGNSYTFLQEIRT